MNTSGLLHLIFGPKVFMIPWTIFGMWIIAYIYNLL